MNRRESTGAFAWILTVQFFVAQGVVQSAWTTPFSLAHNMISDLAREGMTMICVTHEMGFARRVADRVIFMDGGEILEEAPPDEFFTASRNERTRQFLSQVLGH